MMVCQESQERMDIMAHQDQRETEGTQDTMEPQVCVCTVGLIGLRLVKERSLFDSERQHSSDVFPLRAAKLG